MISAGQIIRQRRSLVACDGRTSIPAERFYRMLARVMPVPWDAIPWEPRIHFGLFVHRVEGIEPGLYALALSAWKQAGATRWALRANPSSGNLHPTEGYVLIGGIPELGELPGLFHYAPREHGLERRADCPDELLARLVPGLPPQAFLLGLSSVYWREAWKYGERAFRYCQHDVGHAIGAVRIAAATLGWSALVLDGVADETIETLLGLDRSADFDGAERESAELVMAVWPGEAAAGTSTLDVEAVRELKKQRWYGKANRLSLDDPVPYEAIDHVAAASRKL